MKPLRIVFMGSPDFAIPSLDALHHSDHKIVAVASNPDKRRRRRSKPEPTPVKKRALELNYPVIDVDDVHADAFSDQLRQLKPDLLVVVAFRILPPEILEIPSIGSVNLHASLLPKYRGAAPIHWAVINGEKETGCSVFFLNEKVDTGEIVARRSVSIGEMDTTGDVYNRLKEMGADLLKESTDRIASGNVDPVPQDHSLATPAPKLFAENTRIDFGRTVRDVHNLIRGLNPFPVAWCEYEQEKMNIYGSRPAGGSSAGKPGTLHQKEGLLYVNCADGLLELTEVQLPGTKRMSGREFVNGYELPVILQ